MKNLLLMLLLLVPSLAFPKELTPAKRAKNPIFDKIVSLRPGVNKKFAMQLSGFIAKYSKKFGTDPMLSVAIAMQESSFDNINREGALIKDGEIVHGVTDVGVFQIHVATIEYMGIDPDRLLTDVEYQTFWHTKILAEKIKICTQQREKLQVKVGNEWSCYHSFTYRKRQVYLQDVGAHLTKLRQ